MDVAIFISKELLSPDHRVCDHRYCGREYCVTINPILQQVCSKAIFVLHVLLPFTSGE